MLKINRFLYSSVTNAVGHLKSFEEDRGLHMHVKWNIKQKKNMVLVNKLWVC